MLGQDRAPESEPLSPLLGLYPSKGVDQAIFGMKFCTQEHKGGTFIQSNGFNETLLHLSLAHPKIIKLKNRSRVPF